jgi:hypothetical protein
MIRLEAARELECHRLPGRPALPLSALFRKLKRRIVFSLLRLLIGGRNEIDLAGSARRERQIVRYFQRQRDDDRCPTAFDCARHLALYYRIASWKARARLRGAAGKRQI